MHTNINNLHHPVPKKIVVLGGGGFIGGHLIHKLKELGHWVRGVDIKHNEFRDTISDEFIIADLRDPIKVDVVIDETIDEVYQLAADMGGSTYINTGEHDSDVMHNSCLINLNVLKTCSQKKVNKIFYSSSACVYPEYNQLDPDNPKCSEDTTYPAEPDSEYGWEKLFSERLFFVFHKDFPELDIRVARFHNIYGPYGTYKGGKEKAPAAFCRKVAMAKDGDTVEVFGDGMQTRSFLLVDECVEGIIKLMNSDFKGPVNIGSEEMINMNDFMKMIIKLSGKNLTIKNTEFHGVGVRGRNSDNKLIKEKLGWEPNYPLEKGIKLTYDWINSKINTNNIESLISQVQILKENSDYRCGDIVYHIGERWQHSKNQILNNPKYENTLFKNFLEKNNGKDSNFKFLLKCIEEYCSDNNLPIPDDDELVIHLRMGDVVVHNWFLRKNYINLIKEVKKNNTISKITIVTSFAYQAWSQESIHLIKKAPLWDYTDEKQEKNERSLFELLSNIQDQFNLPITIYSNKNIDVDLCYCVFSKHFIKDEGRFSKLMEKLNQLKLNS